MRRSRTLKPPPHVLEQSDQAPKLDTTQSTGHSCVLQLRVCASVGHALPPLAVAQTMVRVRLLTPVPHDVLHSPQAGSFTTQSIGHAWVLHSRCSVSAGHT